MKLYILTGLMAGVAGRLQTISAADYGIDCSFPVKGTTFRCNNLLGDRQPIYDEYMRGCREHAGPRKASMCDANELDRLEMSTNQPQSMVNYTSTGFKKIRAPAAARKLLFDYWDNNNKDRTVEEWGYGNIYANHWSSPTYMVGVEDTTLAGGGDGLKKAIWDAVKPTLEDWTGMELRPSSMYGIRIYTDGAILSPHADRLPLVSSCIINVAQDVDEPWPLEVFDRHDRAVNVTMQPGDMVLYESGSLIHGRPFPLKGRYFANIFIHFEPTGRPLKAAAKKARFTWNSDLPPYLQPDGAWVDRWRQQNPYGWDKPSPAATIVDSPSGHFAAATGDVMRIRELAAENKQALHQKDRNGWMPIHEAARGGHVDAVRALIEEFGVDVNARTNHGKGGTPLHVAVTSLSVKHPVAQYLESIGALNIGPDL